MVMGNRNLLEKANLTLSDFDASTGGTGGGGTAPLTVEQVQTFLRLAITSQVMLPDVRTVMSNASKWQESKISMDKRIMRAPASLSTAVDGLSNAIELERLLSGDRFSPDTGVIEISTVLLRGEVPISDEVLEDQVERAGFGNTIMQMVAQAAGRDIEDLLINGDTSTTAPATADATGQERAFYRSLDGWIKQCDDSTNGHVVDFDGEGKDYQALLARMITLMPDRYKRDKGNMRFYVSDAFEEQYRDQIAQRSTALGDRYLEGTDVMRYQGVEIRPVPILNVSSGTPDTSSVLLTHRLNLYAGYRRQIRMETWRDPREGGMSFIVSARVDGKVAHVPATVLAKNVDVEP